MLPTEGKWFQRTWLWREFSSRTFFSLSPSPAMEVYVVSTSVKLYIKMASAIKFFTCLIFFLFCENLFQQFLPGRQN